MKIFLSALLAFLLILMGFFWVANQQMNNLSKQLDNSELPDSISVIQDRAIIRGNNFAYQDLEFQTQFNEDGTLVNLSWEILGKVQKSDSYNRKSGMFSTHLTFDPLIHLLHEREVLIEGYIIEIPDASKPPYYLLSAYPGEVSFISGEKGSETIIDLFLKEKKELIEERLLIKGRFQLNEKDEEGMYYRINDVEILK